MVLLSSSSCESDDTPEIDVPQLIKVEQKRFENGQLYETIVISWTT